VSGANVETDQHGALGAEVTSVGMACGVEQLKELPECPALL